MKKIMNHLTQIRFVSRRILASLLLCTVFFSCIGLASAQQQIMITKSFIMDKAVFDGKWSFYMEWKKSSWDPLSYADGTLIHLRTAHQGNFIYVFMDDVETTEWNRGSDRGMVCFDSDNSKSAVPDSNDYCFMATLSGNSPVTLQGGSPLASSGYFRMIPNPEGLLAAASISDSNDRYSPIPHPGYEFRIPTSVIGRSSDYGFYVSVYHSQPGKTYPWPENATAMSPSGIPSPSEWGDLVSPDASLPEFQWPALPLLIAITSLVLLTTRKQISLI